MGRSGTLVDARTSLPEVLRLLDESEAALPGIEPGLRAMVAAGLPRLREEARSGRLEGALFVGPKDEAVGLATWSGRYEAGRSVSVFLGGEARSSAVLASLLRALEAEAPLRSLSEPVPGLPAAEVDRALRPMGFVPVERVDMRVPEGVEMPEVPDDPARPLRPVGPEDEAGIARLLERGYADDRLERALFARRLDPVEDAREGAEQILHGLGRFEPSASFAAVAQDGLAGMTLVNELHGPLISEVVVDPSHRRRGLARRLVARSVAAAREIGLGSPRLVVTVGNEPARALYRSLGFADVPPRGTVWVRPLPR